MKDLWERHILQQILLLGILVALLGLNPTSREVRLVLERVNLARASGSSAAMADNLAELAARLPWRSGLWESAGQSALIAGTPESAGLYFSTAAQQGQLSPAGYLAWGDADWQAQSPATAIQIWQLAARLGATPEQVSPRLVEVYRAQQDYPSLIDALKTYSQQIDQLPPGERASLLTELGLLLAAYDPGTAPPYLLQAIELDAGLETTLGALNFAIQHSLPQKNPAYSLVIAGRELANLNQWFLASLAFENAIASRPDYSAAWAYLGEARYQLGQEPASQQALETAIALDPAALIANSLLALYWQRQGDFQQAIGYLQIAAQADPRNPALLIDIGNLIAAEGDLQQGASYYWQAIEVAPQDPTYIQAFIEFSLRYNLNLRETALPAARHAVKLNPVDPGILDVMGQVLYRLNDSFNAERFYQRALQKDPQYAPAHLHLGVLYSFRGNPALARTHLEQVLLLAPGSLDALQAQRMLDDFFK